MSVPAHTKKWGLDVKIEPATWDGYWKTTDGSYYAADSGATNCMTGYHKRYGNTSNVRDYRGIYPNTAYERRILRGRPIPGEMTMRGYGLERYQRGHFVDTYEAWTDLTAGLNPSLDNVRNRVVTEALAELQDRKVNIGVYLAEAIKSANTIADYAAELWALVLAAKRGFLRQQLRLQYNLNDVPSQYLRWKYGVQPLAADLYNQWELFKTRGSDRMSLSSFASSSETYSSNGDTLFWEDVSHDVKLSARCGIFATVESDFIATATRIGLADPLTIGWELVPYSFVLDWAMPVGNFLLGLSARQGLRFDGGYISYKRRGSVKGRRYMPREYNGFSTTGQANGLEVEYEEYFRESLGAMPLPSLYAKNPFRTGNVMSAIALFHQLTKGR